MTGSHFVHLASAVSGIAMLGAAALSAPASAAPPDNSHNPALPQFNVPGTDYMLHNSVRAEKIESALEKARFAIRRCDEPAFRDAMQPLRLIQVEAAMAVGDFGSNLFAADTARGDAHTLSIVLKDLDAEWRSACGEKKKAEAARHSFTGGAGIHVGRVNLPTLAYLGFEDAITLAQTIGVVDGEDEGAVAGMSIGGSVDLSPHDENSPDVWRPHGWWLEVGVARSSTDVSSSFTNIDPAGDGLLIPGPLGGASGFALPSAGGLNVVSTARFSASYDWTNFHAKFFMPVECETLLLFPFAGLGYTRTGFDASFEGSIPGFARDFAYNTSVDADAISPMAGLEVVRDFGGTSLRAGGLIAVDFNDADGRDRLSFTGFPDSEAMLENDDTTVSGRVWLGVTYGTAASPFALSLDVAWIHAGNVPNITRDGVNPTRLDMDNADAFVGSLGAKIRF
ncbi:MAG: hypothetical protein CVT72_04455 [Alphaproteobacteria bacterium HGW-Alphaproteobacteria-11]|nr:MAG: hypothetical protein CVT72_04455 [Alphaproteobacteria bacterium HGW-Alphaproteobacteria-11]